MMILLSQLWAAMRLRPGIATCLTIGLAAALANYPLWKERQVVTFEHERVRQHGEAILAALTDRGRLKAGPQVLRTRSYRLERTEASGADLVLFLSVKLLARP